MNKIETGKRLRQSRLKAGYKTARSFAAKHNIAHATYSMHEAGRRGLKPVIAHRYAKILNISTAWLLTGEGIDGKTHSHSISVPLMMRTGEKSLGDKEKSDIILPPSFKASKESFAVEVGEETTDKKFNIGDIVFCVPIEHFDRILREGDYYIYRQKNDENDRIYLKAFEAEKDKDLSSNIVGIVIASFMCYI